MEKKNLEQSLFREFLQNFEKIPSEIVDALLRVTTDEDEKSVINAFAPTLVEQFKELSVYLNDASTRTTRQGVAEVEKFLKVSSGVTLTNNFRTALPSIGSVVGKLGLSAIIQEIKKIIKFIFQILKKEPPAWLDSLLLIINQIINHLLSGGIIKTKNALSQGEQNYLAELTAHAKLQKASISIFEDVDDED
ncbi:MAG TPA: hypothetical protein PKC40_00890 [Saprospiraceae bacterium]|nr:hypothetical protein [Saprospiraceae bacterium]